MSKDALKDAIAEMRQEMRGRVGKKLLSIEVNAHTDPEDEDDEDTVTGDDGESKEQRKIGMPLLGG